jgi:signal transduction histidine kinase
VCTILNLLATLRKAAETLIVTLAVTGFLLAPLSAIAVPAKSVLVLYSNNRLVPGNVAVDHGLGAALQNTGERSVRTYSEFLDSPEFSGEAYENLVVSYLHGKYAGSPPDAIVAVSDDALGFIVRHRAQLFPGAPVVYTGVPAKVLQTLQPLPADIVGVPNDFDYSSTISQALRWHPNARRLVIVTGASWQDKATEARLRRELPAVMGGVATEFWSGLPVTVLQNRLRSLDPGSVVFTAGFFQDGDGNQFNPHDSAILIASAAAAPVYGPFETFIGTGVVGGRMPSFEQMGRQAGQAVNAIFAGAAPATLRLPTSTPAPLQLDWRQAQRWRIDEKMIPAGTVVHFKEPSVWEAHRTEVLIALSVILLQAAFIMALFIERRRRSAAELTTQNLNAQLAHASRLAVAGELTAAIAHEINQPLGAIQTSADAADLLLQSNGDRREDLLRIVTRIRRDTVRASDVIRRLRTLLARHEPERRAFDLAAAMSDVAMILRPEAERRKVTLDVRPMFAPPSVAGDRTQIQQVLINLVLNAMDAVTGLPENRRLIEVLIERRDANARISVQDRGCGIPGETLPKLFDSFFSTKQQGMGLGLSIARSIVDAHGGRIWAENREGHGAAFHVELPEAVAEAVALPSPL